MNSIFSEVEKYIKDNGLIRDGGSVLAAVSGGADSMCMLSLLIRYCREHEVRMGVVSVDHGFRPEAAEEVEYVRDFCSRRGVFFRAKRILPGECESSEEAARIRRYQLIGEVADEEGFESIALAHNADDRAETFLFNLIRGTGVRGLGSIRPRRDRYIRPVLCLKRREIEAYLEKENIRYYTDRTNLEDIYARNRIRHNIMPEACGINEKAADHIVDAADALTDAYDFIEGQAREAFRRCVIPATGEYAAIPENIKSVDSGGGRSAEEEPAHIPTDWDPNQPYGNLAILIDTGIYAPLHRALRMEILRMALMSMTPHLKDITARHLADLDALTSKQTGSRIDLPYGIKAHREYNHIYIECDISNKKATFDAADFSREEFGHCISDIKGETERGFNNISSYKKEPASITLDISGLVPDGALVSEDIGIGVLTARRISVGKEYRNIKKYTKYFDYDKIDRQLVIRCMTGDERLRITIDAAGHTKTVQRMMKDLKVPQRLRERIPLVVSGSEVMWIIGYRDSYVFRIDEATKTVLELTVDL